MIQKGRSRDLDEWVDVILLKKIVSYFVDLKVWCDIGKLSDSDWKES